MGTPIDATAAIRRLLVRTGFAANTAQVAAAARAGFPATVAAILAAGPDPGAAATPAPGFAYLAQPGAGDAGARDRYRTELREQTRELTLWWLQRMVVADQPWLERRTLLWHGHWATSIQKVRSAGAMLAQNQTMRALGGGSFDDLARAMVVDPALMVWLDAEGSTARAPNENLARELMELFTLGHGNYSETDVRQAALALTGWRLDRPQAVPTARFVPAQHAAGAQTILGTTKDFTATDLVDLLVAQPASGRYLVARIWGWLVSATPPSDASLQAILTSYGPRDDLTGLFGAILRDPAFLDPGSVLVKSPVEYLVGALRALNLRPAGLTTKLQNAVIAGLTGTGQVPFAPPNVGGWPSGAAWLTTAAAAARIRLASQLTGVADLSAVQDVPPAQRPDAAAALLGVAAWTPRTRAALATAADSAAEVVTLALVAPEFVTSG